jgi:precorrin-3B C17-methyltransferase
MGSLYIIGLGPGNEDGMTASAFNALNKCSLIMGYKTYTKQVKRIFPDKEYKDSAMRQEVERCREAVKEAANQDVALVCSGDSGVYGMVALVYEVRENNSDVEIIIIAGVTAANSGAALVGSPLTNDFAVISLSDLLTPMEVIKKRVEGASMGDFCIVLYNPMSKTRRTQLKSACEIMLKYKSCDTVCAIAHAVGRDDEWYKLITLEELKDSEVDMVSTIYIGNSQTRIIDNKMITRRGYRGV